jgi:hypothetical protein
MEAMNTNTLHMDIHAIIKQVGEELNERHHQEIDYGLLPSMLHLHYLCHALNQQTKVYVEIDGVRREATMTLRPSDSIGRMMNAIVIRA